MSVALKHISDPPPPPTEINPNIPVEVEQAILKALDKEPTRRFENAREFVRNLELAFELSKTGDIAAPKAIVEAIGAPPVTNPVPPPARVSPEDKIKTTNAQIVIDEDSISKKSNTSSVPLTNDGRAGWAVAALLVVLIAIIGGYLFFSQWQTNNANATSTALAVAQQETNVAATSTALESTSLAIAAGQTSEAQTEMAEATGSAEALIARNTADAATEIQQTDNAIATEAEQTSAAATLQAEASRSTATAEAESLQLTQEALTQEALTNEANTEQAQIEASETHQAAQISPTATQEQVTPTFTPSPSPSPTFTPSVTPLPTATPTPSLLISSETDTAQVMLRYDGRMLILGNRDEANSIDVSDLVFVQVAPDDNGIFRETINFTIARTDLANAASNLGESRCLEILDSTQFSSLPSQNPLATNLCGGTPFWVTTTSPFWMHDNPQAYFEVRLGAVDVLTRCPVQRPLTRAELRCAVDINAIP